MFKNNNTELYIFFVVLIIILIYIIFVIIGIMIYKLKRRKSVYLWNFLIVILRVFLPFFSYFFFGQIFSFLTSVFYCRKEESYESPYLHCLEGLWIYSLTPAAIVAMVFQIIIAFLTNTLYYKSIFKKDDSDCLKKTDSFPDIVFMFTKTFIILLFISDKGLESEHWAMISFLVFITGLNAYYTLLYQNRQNKILMHMSNIFSLITFFGYLTLFFGKIFRTIEFNGLLYLFIFDIIIIIIYHYSYKRKEIKFVNIDYKTINNSEDYLNYIIKYYTIIKNINKRSSLFLLKSFISKLEEKCFDPDCPLNKYLHGLEKGIECQYFLFQYCDKLFQYGISKFSDNIALKNNYSTFLLIEMNNKKKAAMILNTIKNQLICLQMNYNIYRTEHLINNYRKQENNVNNRMENYSNNIHELKSLITKVTLSRCEFLSLILGSKIKKVDNFKKIYSLGSIIQKNNKKIDEIFNELIITKANNIEIINLYSEYVEKILEDEDKYEQCQKKKKLILSNIQSFSENNFFNFDIDTLKEKNIFPFLIISADLKNLGIIKDCSIGLSKIFGYQKEELVGKNINILIPEIFHKKHDLLLVQHTKNNKFKFYEDLSKNKIYSPDFLKLNVYAVTKSKLLISLKLKLFFFKTEENDLVYVVEIIKDIPMINDENNNDLKCCILTDENFLIQTFTPNSIYYLNLNYNHINSNYEILNNIKQFQEDCLIDFNASHMTRNCSMKESSIITQKRVKKTLVTTSIFKSIKIDILNKNYAEKTKITWVIDEDCNNKKKTKIFKKKRRSTLGELFANSVILSENIKEKEFFMEIKKIILDKELIGYYFYFSKVPKMKPKLIPNSRHHSFKKTEIRQRVGGKSSKKVHQTQKLNAPIVFEEKKVSNSILKRRSSLDKSIPKVKFEKNIFDDQDSFVNADFIPDNNYNFLFNLNQLYFSMSKEKDNGRILNDALNKEVVFKIKKYQFKKNSLILRKKKNYSTKKLDENNAESEEYTSSESSEFFSSSNSVSNEESAPTRKTAKSTKSLKLFQKIQKNKEEEDEDDNEIMKNIKLDDFRQKEETKVNQIKKKILNEYYKVNLNNIKLLKFDYYKEIFFEVNKTDDKNNPDKNNGEESNNAENKSNENIIDEKISQIDVNIKNIMDEKKPIIINDECYPAVLIANNKAEKNSKEKQENKITKKDTLINEEKMLEKKIYIYLNKKKDEPQIIKLKIYSFVYLIIMTLLFFGCFFYFHSSYSKLKGLLNLVKNTVKIKYCDRMSVFYVGESTLLNFNADKIKGGIFINFPANPNNKKGYITLMREKIKESFLENELALKGLLSSDIKLTENTTNYLNNTYLNTDIVMIDGSIEIISADIFTTLMQYNGAFYNLASSQFYLEQNHSDILNFLHNSFNDYAKGINLLMELYSYELESQAKSIELIWIIGLVLYFIIYIIIYIIIVYFYILSSKKRTSYMEILYGIDEKILKMFISNCENFYRKMEKTQSKVVNDEDEEEELKDSIEGTKSYRRKQKKGKRKSLIYSRTKKEENDENLTMKNKLPDNIFGFMKYFGFLLLITFGYFIYNALYFINLNQTTILISRYFYKVQNFHSKMIDIFIAYRQYIFDDSIIIYNMLPFDYLEKTEKDSYETLSDDVEFINDFLKTYLSDNKEVQDMLNQSFCNYNFTDKFSSYEDCKQTLGQILNYDFSIVAANFIEELRINKFLLKYLLSTGTIKGNLNDYNQTKWLNDPTIPKKDEDYTGPNIFRLDIYNNETLHAHLDLIFVNIILPYIDINRKYILPNLSIDNRDFLLYLTSVFYGIFVLLIYFVYLLLKIRFINRHIYKTKKMLTLIPINILASQKNIKQLVYLSEEN